MAAKLGITRQEAYDRAARIQLYSDNNPLSGEVGTLLAIHRSLAAISWMMIGDRIDGNIVIEVES